MISIGLDPEAWIRGRMDPSEAASSPGRRRKQELRLFFFRGTGHIAQTDLPHLQRALDASRQLARQFPAGGRKRREFKPAQRAYVTPTDAARLGFRQARKVRQVLGLGSSPIEDMKRLAQEALGVTVSSAPFEGRVSAMGLVADRGEVACILIDSGRRGRDGFLVAHELSHILFDPVRQGLSLSLDRSEVPDEQRDLDESRANGFAAELLLPLGGLIDCLGRRKDCGDLGEAEEMVATLQQRFHTTRATTAYHLLNHGFIRKWICDELLHHEARGGGSSPAVAPRAHVAAVSAPAAGSPLLAEVQALVCAGRSREASLKLGLELEDLVRQRCEEKAEALLAETLDSASAEAPWPAHMYGAMLTATMPMRERSAARVRVGREFIGAMQREGCPEPEANRICGCLC